MKPFAPARPDVRNVRPTGDGKATNTRLVGLTGVSGRIYNFDIDGHALKKEHHEWLRKNVVPFLMAGGSCTLTALTSRKGSDSHNLALSKDRLLAVQTFLEDEVKTPFRVATAEFLGESVATLAGEKEGSENELWRAVDLIAWANPTPPPAPPPVIKPPEPAAKVERIVHREFLATDSEKAGPGGAPPPAADDLLKEIIKLIKGSAAPDDDGEQLTERRKALVPGDYDIAVVRIRRDYSSTIGTFGDSWTVDKKSVDYEWGPPRSTVSIIEHTLLRTLVSDIETGRRETDTTKIITRAEARKSKLYTPPPA
jgi:hypothetical protein